MNSSIILNNRKSLLARKLVHKSRTRISRDQRSGDVDVNSTATTTASFHVQSLLQNRCNFRSSGDVARLLYFDGCDWVDYEREVVEAVRVCWEGVVEVRIGGGVCVFDFYRMLVVDVGRGVEKSVAWIDVAGRCFFPKFVVGEVSSFSSFRGGLGEVEVEVRVSGGEIVSEGCSGGENVVDEVKRKVIGLRDGSDGLGKVGVGVRVSGGGLGNERKREGENVVDEVNLKLGDGANVNSDGLGKVGIEVRVSGGGLGNERERKGENVVDAVKSGGSSLRDGLGGDLEGLRKVGTEGRVSGGELMNERIREGGNVLDQVKSMRECLDENSGGLGNEVRVSGGELSKKRKREGENEVKSVGSCSNVMKKRVVEEEVSEVESIRWKNTRLIGEGGKPGMVVKNLFLNWQGIKGIGAEITGMHQITRTDAVDKARYEGFMNQVVITKAARGNANVTFAWVKCSSEGVERILTHGFSGPVRGSLGGGYGVGIYLSPFKSTGVSLLHQDAGENHVILCRVILGKCEKVQGGSQQLYPSSVEFDTGVDDVNNPKWYIVWGANMNTHILPECVVSYKHTRYHPGQLFGTQRFGQAAAKPSLTWIPKMANAMTAKFFAQLLRSLPSSKLPELRTLCSTYKAGKVPKGIFMRKLRSVVGDQMLRTAIQEVRG
ncbi:uncharacterized protein LOC141692289 [Apium graveolens]|uniref:uncharacterized protein LOC141692289 n=1 Tax=Apium graveolens TaxID=4045 RepID=UPI003D792CE5